MQKRWKILSTQALSKEIPGREIDERVEKLARVLLESFCQLSPNQFVPVDLPLSSAPPQAFPIDQEINHSSSRAEAALVERERYG